MSSGESLIVLDVGHGNCTVVRGNRDTVLIDAGPGSAVLEFLLQQGIGQVSMVLISHADADHIKGLVALLDSAVVEVAEVRVNNDALKDSETWKSLVYSLDDAHRRGQLEFKTSLTEGDQVPFDSDDVELEVLAPRRRLVALGAGSVDREGNTIDTNTVSAVVRVSQQGEPIALLTGDIDAVGFKHLEDTGQRLSAPLLVFPHHGGRAGRNARSADNAHFAKVLCEAVEPKDVLFSTGRGRHATPRPEVMRAIRECAVAVRIACTQLSEHCALDLPSTEPKHLLQIFAAGRGERHCCAGTVQIDLGGRPGAVMPAEGHQDFVDTSAPTALCRDR
jgi:beta-lactamase superfamily II metal-dependent hydrolase